MATRSNPESTAGTTGRGAKATPTSEQAPPTSGTEPTPRQQAVGEPTSGRTTSDSEYARNNALLKISVQVPSTTGDSDSDCLPSADQIQVFHGDTELNLQQRDGFFEGSYDLDNVLVDVVADSFTCQNSCRRYDPVIDRTAILLNRGCTAELTLPYQLGLAAIQITPHLIEPQPEGAEVGRPIPGVRFLLFDGPPGNGRPLERVSTVARPTVSFTDLEPGDKTLVVDAPKRFEDRPIELRNSRYATYRIQVGGGQNLVLDSQFEFESAAGGVTVQVVDHADERCRIRDVPVRLVPTSGGVEPGPVTTDDKGLATFSNVPAGAYRVELDVDPVQADGTTWTTSAAPIVTVTTQDSGATVDLRLLKDRHLVQGTVFGPQGEPLPYALVEIRRTPEDQTPLDTAITDKQGRYEWEAPYAGTFYLAVVEQDGGARRVVPVGIHSTANQDLYTDGAFRQASARTSRGQSDEEEDPTPFPLLVGSVDLTEGTAPTRGGGGDYSGSGFGSARSAGAVVSAAIRDVLGYRTRTTDTKGFVAALQRSFSCEEMLGYTVCNWTPRSYAATIPADFGALTGAQASIFERAKVTVDATLPLLDGLAPLLSDADTEDVEAIRAIVRSRLTEIVAELSLEGGPRTQRVDELFERLTGQLPSTSPQAVVLVDVNTLRGELQVLGDRFGMIRREVNTIAEEENFTNFLIIVDGVATLFVSWQQTRAFFLRDIVDDPTTENDAPFLGTQLVLISRQLNVISETVRETYFAMDSVFLGAAERQTVLLRLKDEGRVRTTMLLSELLDWVDRFATDEGPQLIEEAGTDGVNALVPTINRLATLVASAPQQRRDDPQIPPSFFTARVQLALRQLASQLLRAADLANAVFERLELKDIIPGKPGKPGKD